MCGKCSWRPRRPPFSAPVLTLTDSSTPPTTGSLYASENIEGIHLAPLKTNMVVIPRIPQDIINEILDILAASSDFRTLQSCALLSKSWVQPCRRHLFHTVRFTLRDTLRWFETFPVPEQSPGHHIRDLRVEIGRVHCVPDAFFERISWFTDVERMSLSGDGWIMSSLRPSLWRLPRSITSLTIDTNVFTHTQVWDIIAQLPNLDDLSLSGSSFSSYSEIALPEPGIPQRGRFGGRLLLRGGYASQDVMDGLSEIPVGLRFTEVEIFCGGDLLLSAVRLAEACGKTILKLSQTVDFFCKPHPFSRSNWF